MRILVTGASGFTGAVLARRLAGAGHHVTGLYRASTLFLTPLKDMQGVVLHCGDIHSLDLVGPFDAVVHAAARSPGPGVDAVRLVQDNVFFTEKLIGFAKRWRSHCFIFCSSLSLYGSINVAVVDELTPVVSPDTYGATKHLCELLLRDSSEWLPSLSLRLPGVLGPGAHRNWMSGVANCLLNGDIIRAFNITQPFNNAVHVEDIADLALRVLEHPFQGSHSLVLGATGVITVRQAIETLAQAMGVPAQIEEVTANKHSFCLSSERAIRDWGYSPMEIRQMLGRYGQDVLRWNS
jgi:nucleoside-diphosphate-sugar epimerase